ncbi:MAG: septum formation initiator family protein [Phascolarctobacterium sp.]|nr:septum formation initiator family protein [Phascolarctobacterium sp.]MBR5486375.1 septum formation initiator family protein [Phascolarctobacterium sp.]MBR5797232.1 septum formation initiator family protein [Phascolarctobacterium sp.]MBR6511692.1 septum formation initiator family protein [Phascolarctobacterium sp.]
MQKRKKRGNRVFTYILGIVVLVCLGIVIEQEYKIYQLKQEKAATEARIDALNEKQAKLEAERKKLDDPKYLEKLAREDYNMVGKNEVPLFIVDEKKAAQEPK